MSKSKYQPAVAAAKFSADWWIWLGDTYKHATVEAEPVRITQTPDIIWGLAENPYWTITERKWMLAEWGTGYVLAYGSDRSSCIHNARINFRVEVRGWKQADITQLIHGHLEILKRHMRNNPDFKVPQRLRQPILQPV